MNLNQTQLPFNNEILNYNLKKYPLPDVVLEVIKSFYPNVESLDTLHEVIPSNLIAEVMNKASHKLLQTDFYDHFDSIVKEYVVPQIGTEVLIQKFGNLRALIPNQDKISAVLPFHQGRWVGNGLGLRTIWMPFTKCFESNSMQILDLDISRKITRESIKEKWSYEKLEKSCIDNCWPITLDPGQAHLFFQEHLHGNIPNRTNKTRVSIDIRLLIKDGAPHRKWPGAYFRQLFDRDYRKEVKVLPSEKTVTYAEYEGKKTKHLDLHFQTLVVKSYCQKNSIPFPYQHGDNEGTNYAHLNHLICDTEIDHLLMFSIFSLPDDKEHRIKLMRAALEKSCKIHFCNEELVLENEKDFDKIETLRSWTSDWSNPVDQLKEELGIS
jgi:sporadic carbohydrate cluster 2OG-Fe(II) oxygenase/sporadic carbohydrate cluster protein (TIGR04323 family)